MKVGILGAMPEEVSAIKQLMTITGEIEIGGRTYSEGSIDDIEIVLTFSRWGKVASSSTTTTLINKFDVDLLIFTGVAGAVNKELNIGDVVIGKGLYQHDMDARPLFDQYQIPLTDHIVFSPDPDIISKATKASEKFISNIEESISQGILTAHSIFKPKVYLGLIASGDKFISNPDSHEEINYSVNGEKTIAVEMEGAAVAQVCTEFNVPYLIIRTISDKADHDAVVDFQSFIQHVASKYSAGIIKNFLSL